MTITADATDQLVGRAVDLAASPVADEVDRRVRHLVLDHLGCTLAGQGLPYTAPSFAALGRLTAPPEATGADGTLRPAFVTAYLNGTAANALDYDDTLYGHPGAPVTSAALAMGERVGGRLGDLVRAVVVGYQAHWLLARAAAPSAARARRVRAVGVFDAIAAAAACVTVSGPPDPERLRRAVAVAATQSCVPYVAKWYERPVPSVKNNLGWTAASGVLAADLAGAGAVGLPNVLDGQAGFWAMAGSDRWRWPETVAEDAVPAVLRAGFKRFPACWHVQQYLTVLSRLLDEAGPAAVVAGIDFAGPHDLQKFGARSVDGMADVAFSLPTLGTLLARRIPIGADWVSGEALAIGRPLLASTTVCHSRQRSVTVTLADGRRLRAAVPKGDYGFPYRDGLTEAEVRHKFTRLAGAVLGAGTAERLADAVLRGPSDLPLAEATRWLRGTRRAIGSPFPFPGGATAWPS